MHKKLKYFLLALIFVACSWALFSSKFFRVHDYTHAARISEMSLALQDGHFPVRWTKNFGYGWGMPLFEFYGPLPFYVGSFFYLLGFDVVLAIKILYLICNLGTMIGAYLLAKKLFVNTKPQIADMAGILAAAALTLSPYRAVNLYIRGALNEAWGIMAIPWILLGIVKVINCEKKAWLTLVLSLCVLMLSHNITVMIFLPISVLFGFLYLINKIILQDKLFWIKKKFNFKQVLLILKNLLLSYLFSISLSAFYLFPAYLEKGATKVEETILTPYFNFRLHFLYIRQFLKPYWGFGGSEWGPNDPISFFLGYGQIVGLLITAFMGLIIIWKLLKKKKIKPDDINLFILFLMMGISLYMTLLKSQWFWELFPILEFVQFPWRFMSISIVLGALILAYIPSQIKKAGSRLLIFVILLSSMIMANFNYFRPEKYLDNADDYYYTDPVRIQKNMSSILPDYIPASMPEEFHPPENIILSKISQDNYQILVDRTHQKLFRVNIPRGKSPSGQDTQLIEDFEIAVAQYPGWEVEVNGTSERIETGDLGNLKVKLQSGENLVAFKYTGSNITNFSDMISLVSFLLLIALLIKIKPSKS